MESLKQKTVKGVLWNAADRFSTQGISFVFGLLIARLLVPADYGIVAMIGIFMALSSCFIDSGFGTALTQKKNRTETDFSTVFYFNIVVALLAYAVLWVAAPWIATFYNMPLLEDVTRVVALNLVVGALGGIPGTKLAIAINFRAGAKASVASCLASGVIGLWMAYHGYGVWALVAQGLTASVVRCVLLWVIVSWTPRLVFSWTSFRQLFTFGSKMLASALIDTTYNNISPIVIGKFFSPTVLGNYTRAFQLAQYPSSNITNILQCVTFPVLCSMQDDDARLADAYRRFLRMTAFVIFPLMIGLSAVSDPLIRLLLTDRWTGCIYLLQIVCFCLMWWPVHSINLNLLQVKGRSDYFLRLEIIKKVIGVSLLCITIPLGVVAMCYGSIVSSLLCLVVNSYYTQKLIGYGFAHQIKDLAHILITALLMGVIAWGTVQLMPTLWSKLVGGVAAGGIFYLGVAAIFHYPEIKEIKNMMKR